MNEPRIKPLKPEELTAEQAEFLKPVTNKKGAYPNIFGTMAHHMALFEAWADFGMYTMQGSDLDPGLREILILRTSHNIKCDYEWHHHRRIGLAVGLSDDLIDRVAKGDRLDTPEQNLMMQCADELAAQNELADDTWTDMADSFGFKLTLDAIFIVGSYTALGMTLKTLKVRLED